MGKGKVDQGIFKVGKGEDFTDFGFKEGHTATMAMKDVFIQEKGADALKKREAPAAKVKGASKVKKGKARSESPGSIRKKASKILKYSPKKDEDTPKGKASAKKSATKGKSSAMPTPAGGKKSQPKTTDQMTMAKFKKFLEWHEKKKAGGATKVLGKRSSGKVSASAGKAGKKSK